MQVESLRLAGWRNFKAQTEISLPDKGLMVALAPNATGKTNLLEALVVVFRGKTWRGKVSECVAWEGDSFGLAAEVKSLAGDKTIAAAYDKKRRALGLMEDGHPVSLVKLYGAYPLILFVSEDVYLLSRGPAVRRVFLNRVLFAHSNYLANLVRYQRVLGQRNQALKLRVAEAEIEPWTEALCEAATLVWKARSSLVTWLADKLANEYEKVSGEELDLSIELALGVPSGTKLKEALRGARDLENKYGYTIYGPHRDDMVVRAKGQLAVRSLSAGQVRGVVVALKIAAASWLKKVSGEEPLMLMDEILSELDSERQERLLSNLPQGQVLMTCTSLPEAIRRRDGVTLLNMEQLV